MKELVRFSLYRRFNNRATKIFNLIVFIVIGCFLFSDKLLYIVNPSLFEKEVIYIKNIDADLSEYLKETIDEYVFKETKKSIKELNKEEKLVLAYNDESYYLYSKYEMDELKRTMLESLINTYHQNKYLEESKNTEAILEYSKEFLLQNEILEKDIDSSDEKNNLIFIFVTSIYFMMIGFVSGVASEIVNEKATKTLELILTSVQAKTHFYAKLFVGWLVIVIQGGLTLSYCIFWFLIRSLYDQGSALLEFVNSLDFIEIKGNTFYAALSELDFTFLFFQKLFIVLLFLLLGVLIVQLVLVILSSFVSSVEEAGNIQAPFYLILLGFYYLVIALNNPQDLSEGIGYVLSFVPFCNMLLMPCRLMLQEVAIQEIIVSLSISILMVFLVIKNGIPIYERGVLDYSCKGLLQVIKSLKGKQIQKEGNKKNRVKTIICDTFHLKEWK